MSLLGTEFNALMDPDAKAATELNAFFRRLQVPCEVRVDTPKGKHVVATADVPTKNTLVEELPIVSWPARSFLAMQLPFCFHCLRMQRAAVTPPTDNGNDNDNDNDEANRESGCIAWSECGLCGSGFCSDACRGTSRRVHLLLCSALTALRGPTEEKDEEDKGGPHGRQGKSCRDDEGSITPESIARCAAWLITRIAGAVEQQQLTGAELSSSFSSSGGGGGSALVRQLFSQAAAPFDRLVGAPDSAVFEGIPDPKVWFELIRSQLRERSVKLLTLAAAAAAKTGEERTVAVTATVTDGSSSGSDWAAEVADAALRDDTLRVFLSQLTLNSHAVSDYVFLGASRTAEATKEEEEGGEEGLGPAAAPLSPPPQDTRFAWVLKGAAVYSLLSAFNHSCEPNVTVTCVDGTHEIALTTARPVAQGEELNITYIPLRDGSTAKERREQLRSYFFLCQCPRCLAEGGLEAGRGGEAV